MDRVKRMWYLSPMWAAKVQASLCIRAVSPEPLLLAHTSSESRGIFRQKARSLAPLNGWACTVKICHDGMLEDTNLLDGAHMFLLRTVEKYPLIINKVTLPICFTCCLAQFAYFQLRQDDGRHLTGFESATQCSKVRSTIYYRPPNGADSNGVWPFLR